jgi:hypothetical protein
MPMAQRTGALRTSSNSCNSRRGATLWGALTFFAFGDGVVGCHGDDGSALPSRASDDDAKRPDGACAAWLQAPRLDPSIVPDADAAFLHAAATGIQSYRCQATPPALADAGASYAWVLSGPRADLRDCHGAIIGHHFVSDAARGSPQWQMLDGTFVVGSKRASYAPPGAAASIPWLLIEVTGHGGPGTLERARWVSRVSTSGGAAPTTACDNSTVGMTRDVDYTADYFFWGP